MRWIIGISGLLCWIGWTPGAMAQCPSADFNSASTACLNQTIPLTNLSGAGSYSWDFCAGDLSNTPGASDLFTLPGASGRPGIEFAKDGGLWYGFVAGFFSNSLYRIRFANGLNNAPTLIEDLGTLAGSLVNPGQIRIIQEAGLWYGILHNTTPGDLLKISFGNSLANAPSATPLTTGLAAGFENSGLAIGKDPVNGWVSIISGAGFFSIIRLGNGLTSPGPSDIIISGGVPSAADIDIINVCGNWYGFAAGNFGNPSVYRLDFGANLFSSPSINTVVSPLPAPNLGRLRILKEGDKYFVLVTNIDLTGMPLFKLSFGNDLTQVPSVTTESNLSAVPGNSYALAVAKETSTWAVVVMSQSTGRTFLINYPNNCGTSPQTSTAANPQIVFNQAGNYQVSLDYTTAAGTANKTRAISVSGSLAPDIDFTTQNLCVNNSVNFSSVNSSGNLTSYGWNFGDSGTAAIANPSHVFVTAGSFDVSLTVGASNGCSNTLVKPVQIYNLPVADFQLPSVSPFCTNQSYVFTNSSAVDPAAGPTWEWRLNGVLVSNSYHLTQAFSTTASQDIRLKAKIPGCENEILKTISTVVTGPLIDFSVSDNCVGASVGFINTSMGVVTGYQWAFGDGATSTSTNANHTFSSNATFLTTLTGTNAAGCQNFITKPITIYSLPQPDFAVGLPPFSCTNTPTSFQNNTPALTDSNITGWAWMFGDAAGGTSNQSAPAYTYTQAGAFNATLTATTNKGCVKTITKPVTISLAPVADFAVSPACLNLSTQFTDLSSGGVQTRFWQIGSSTFGVPNPAYTFTSTGNFFATLSVTSANSCISVKTKTISVPVPPTLNFSTLNACAGKTTTFTDITSSPADVVVGWNWNLAGSAATGNPAQISFTPDGTYSVKLTTTHTSGCSYTLSRNVMINPSPIAGFTATPDRGAAPLIVQFTNTSQQASSYAWKFYDKVTATSTQVSPVHTFTSLGDYAAELTASNAQGCSDVLTVPIKVLIPSIDLIMQDFSLVTDPGTGKLKGQVKIFNNSNTPVGAMEVALFLSDKAVVNETVVLNLNPGQSASKILSFTLSPNQFEFGFLCAEILSEKDLQQDNNKRCIELDQTDYFFNPYPNPTAGTLHADWISQNSGTAHLVVYNSMGQKSYEWETAAQAGLNQVVLDLTFLTSGLYYLTIETSVSRKTMRFLRE